MALKGRIQMKNIAYFETHFRTWCNGPHKQSDFGWWIILSFKPLKVNSCNCSAQSHTVPCQHTFLAKMFWNVSPEQMTGVLGYRNLDWVSSYFHSRICGRKLFDILRPQRWRCTERQNVITAPPHSRRPLDGGQWMTCWQADNSRNFLDGARKEVPLWYPNLLPCIWWTHVPLDHGDFSDLSCKHSGEDMPHGDTPKGQPEVVLVIYTQVHKFLKHLALRIGVMNLPFLY